MTVIDRVHLLAQGMPAPQIFTDRAGCVIGDVVNEPLYHDNNEYVEALVDCENCPVVHIEETDNRDYLYPQSHSH